MESSYHYHTILLFVCFAIIYAQSIRHSEFSIYKKKRIPFILYSSSFFITAIALIGMFIFRHDSDVFYLFMGLYLLGGLIKLIGKMIYAKLVKDEYLYKSIATPLKNFFFNDIIWHGSCHCGNDSRNDYLYLISMKQCCYGELQQLEIHISR